MLNVFDCWLDKSLFDSQFEFAVRSWAIQSPEVEAEVKAADRQRLEALKKMFLRYGYTERSADVRARTLYLVQIGYISMQSQEDLETRLPRIPEYVEIYTGQAPQQRELDRFYGNRIGPFRAADTVARVDAEQYRQRPGRRDPVYQYLAAGGPELFASLLMLSIGLQVGRRRVHPRPNSSPEGGLQKTA